MKNKLRLLAVFICFALGSTAHANQKYEELDTFESFNRSMYSFNVHADRYLLKPVAQAYKYVAPNFVNEGITNFFNNLDDVETFANSLLQAKFHNATVTLNRIIYNTVFGLGGLIDVATSFGLTNTEEDFGQTLAVWGYESSTYLVLPFLGPSTVRDLGGRFIDAYFEPLPYDDDIHRDALWATAGLKLVDKRADLLGAENLFKGADEYQFVRNAYFQNREYLIKDGRVSDPFANEELENFEDF